MQTGWKVVLNILRRRQPEPNLFFRRSSAIVRRAPNRRLLVLDLQHRRRACVNQRQSCVAERSRSLRRGSVSHFFTFGRPKLFLLEAKRTRKECCGSICNNSMCVLLRIYMSVENDVYGGKGYNRFSTNAPTPFSRKPITKVVEISCLRINQHVNHVHTTRYFLMVEGTLAYTFDRFAKITRQLPGI